jgi:hypothetical protein
MCYKLPTSKIITNADGSTQDFFPQSYIDDAIVAAATATGPNVQITDTGITVTHTLTAHRRISSSQHRFKRPVATAPSDGAFCYF